MYPTKHHKEQNKPETRGHFSWPHLNEVQEQVIGIDIDWSQNNGHIWGGMIKKGYERAAGELEMFYN